MHRPAFLLQAVQISRKEPKVIRLQIERGLASLRWVRIHAGGQQNSSWYYSGHFPFHLRAGLARRRQSVPGSIQTQGHGGAGGQLFLLGGLYW